MKKIPLSQGKYALVDDEDFEYLNQWKWQYKNGYATRDKSYSEIALAGKGSIHMHRVINNTPVGFETDHINGNRVDNTKSNLRTVSKQENQMNRKVNANSTTGYKGVIFDKENRTYRARISISGKRIHLGRFKLPEHAALAYNEAAAMYHGRFARLNKI